MRFSAGWPLALLAVAIGGIALGWYVRPYAPVCPDRWHAVRSYLKTGDPHHAAVGDTLYIVTCTVKLGPGDIGK
jgi:hypothetical protein